MLPVWSFPYRRVKVVRHKAEILPVENGGGARDPDGGPSIDLICCPVAQLWGAFSSLLFPLCFAGKSSTI